MQVQHIPESSNISSLHVKVLSTGQDIFLADSKYVQIFKEDESRYVLAYSFYHTRTRLVLRCEETPDKVVVKVEEYVPNPLYRSRFNVYIKGQKILSDGNEQSVSIQYAMLLSQISQPKISIPPAPPKLAEWITPIHSLSDLKIVIVSTKIGGPCGLAVYADELIEELSKIVSVNFLSIPVFGIKRENKKYYQQLYDEIIGIKPNLVHLLQHAGTFQVYSDLANFTSLLRSLGIKVVISATSPYTETVSADASHISKIADLTLLHTQRELDFFKDKTYGKVSVLQHGIKIVPDEPKNEARQKNSVIGSPVIATHGMFAPTYKGVDYLITAISILKKTHPNIRLLLICAADRYPIQEIECELQVNHLGLKENVSFYPRFLPTEQVYSLLHCADIVAFPYVGEFKDISGAFRKGLASRRPVIVSNSPCFDPEFPLIKVPQKNPEALAGAIKDLYENPDKAKKYVNSTISFIEDFSWKNISKKLADFYLHLWD